MAKIIPAFETYVDLAGNPLEGGYIYIGDFGVDPETAPQTVYWDEDCTIVAAQPIRTIGGFAARSGAPANIYAKLDYSITVKNALGVVIYTDLISRGDGRGDQFENYKDFFASARSFTEGTIVSSHDGIAWQIVAGAAEGHIQHPVTGQWLYVIPQSGGLPVWGFNAVGDWDIDDQTGTGDAAAFQAACDAAGTLTSKVVVPYPTTPNCRYYLERAVEIGNNGKVSVVGPHSEAWIIQKSGDDAAFTSDVTDFCSITIGIIGMGGNTPADNVEEKFPAIIAHQKLFGDVFVGWCGGPLYTGTSEYTLEGNVDTEPTTGNTRSRCYAVGLFGDGDTGTNTSSFRVRGAYIGGDVVFIGTEPGGTRNQNGMNVIVAGAFQYTGYAVNIQRGVRNKIECFTVQSTFAQGGIRCADTSNDMSIYYIETTTGNTLGRAFTLEGGGNTCRLSYAPGWDYVGAGAVNETFALVNTNNQVIIDSPRRYEYSGYNAKEFAGVAPIFHSGITSLDDIQMDTDKGIVFGGSTNAFADYSLNTYTATLTPATSGSITLDTTYNKLGYTKIGAHVFVTGQINVTSVAAPVGAFLALSLPFSIADLDGLAGRGAFSASLTRGSSVYVVSLQTSPEAGSTARIITDASAMTVGDSICFGFHYRAA